MITDAMARTLAEVRLGFVATVSPDGTPNLSPKGTTLAYDDEHLVFADIRSPRTVENLRANPAVEVNVIDVGTRRGWRFRGTGRVVEAGAQRDALLAWYRGRGHELDGRADRFVLVRVEAAEELTSPAYDWGETEEELLRFYAAWYGGIWATRLEPPPVAEALDRDGTFLDVGCGDGALLEALARLPGRRIEPYGLDAAAVVERTRRRLPQWADRIFSGDPLAWEPPRRFTFVRTELRSVPGPRRRELLTRLLERFVEPGGRLLVCSHGSLRANAPTERVGELLRDFGFEPGGELLRERPDGSLVRVAWVGVPG